MKLPLQVIRVEHPSDELGVWRSKQDNGISRIDTHSEFYDIIDVHRTALFPAYFDDDELNHQIKHSALQEYKFAFKSIEQLKTAFTTKQLKELISCLGFNVYLLTVTDYFESSFQVVFKGCESKENISQLFN